MKSSENITILFTLVATTIILLLITLTIVLIYAYRKKREQYTQQLEQIKLEHEKQQLKIQLEIQEETFQNISREIHDNIGLSLSLAKLYLNVLTFKSTKNPEEILASSISLIGIAISDLSSISKGLNSEAISNQGFLNSLKIEIQNIEKLKQFEIEFDLKGEPVFLDSQKELLLYRIFQEALNNIIKHSRATKITLQVVYNDAGLYIAISDNGIGIDWKGVEELQKSRIMAGINNMKKRAEFINGVFSVTSNPTCGTTIEVTVPT
jgi:two-component system, NarL family, sensor kinase